jgi:hypothetical protein
MGVGFLTGSKNCLSVENALKNDATTKKNEDTIKSLLFQSNPHNNYILYYYISI